MKRIYKIGGVAAAGALVLTMGVAAYAKDGDHKAGHRAERMEHLFEMLDANGDGAIDKAEVEGAQAARFAATDANGDGQLTAAEIKAASVKRAEKRAERIMQRLDANSDGVVDEAEHAAAGHKHGGKRAAKMFKRFDADGDGRVTRAEAEAHMAARHKKHDG